MYIYIYIYVYTYIHMSNMLIDKVIVGKLRVLAWLAPSSFAPPASLSRFCRQGLYIYIYIYIYIYMRENKHIYIYIYIYMIYDI